jgi:hypothetical protein
MFRVQAFIVSQDGSEYTVEALAEGVDTPFIFKIDAKSDNEAAMEAIRRVEALEGLLSNDKRAN